MGRAPAFASAGAARGAPPGFCDTITSSRLKRRIDAPICSGLAKNERLSRFPSPLSCSFSPPLFLPLGLGFGDGIFESLSLKSNGKGGSILLVPSRCLIFLNSCLLYLGFPARFRVPLCCLLCLVSLLIDRRGGEDFGPWACAGQAARGATCRAPCSQCRRLLAAAVAAAQSSSRTGRRPWLVWAARCAGARVQERVPAWCAGRPQGGGSTARAGRTR